MYSKLKPCVSIYYDYTAVKCKLCRALFSIACKNIVAAADCVNNEGKQACKLKEIRIHKTIKLQTERHQKHFKATAEQIFNIEKRAFPKELLLNYYFISMALKKQQ